MKTASLKTFVNKKFNRYYEKHYKDKKTKTILLKHSESDFRLKMLCASFYASQEKFKSAIQFNPEYISKEAYLNSNDKYVWEYNQYIEDVLKAKEYYFNKLSDLVRQKSLSIYFIAKLAESSPINVSRYLNEKNLSTLSNEKVQKVLDFYAVDKV